MANTPCPNLRLQTRVSWDTSRGISLVIVVDASAPGTILRLVFGVLAAATGAVAEFLGLLEKKHHGGRVLA